jgi:Dicarboxylate transport
MLLRRGLARTGFPDARFVIERFDASGIRIAGLRAGDALEADAIELDFAFRRLPDLPIDRVRIVRSRVDLTRVASASATPEARASSGSASVPLALLPRLELDDLRVVVPSADGAMTVVLRSHPGAEGGPPTSIVDGTVESSAINATFHAETRLRTGSAVSMTVQIPSLAIHRPKLRVNGMASGGFDVDTSGLDIRSANGRIEASLSDTVAGKTDLGQISGTIPIELAKRGDQWSASIANATAHFGRHELDASGISVDASEKSIDLNIARLSDTAGARRFEPLSLRARWLDTKPRATFTADVGMAGGRATLHASGIYDGEAGRAHVDLRLPRTRLDPDGLKLAELSPRLASTEARGAIEGTAKLDWTAGKDVATSATIVVDDLSLDAPSVRVDGLAGTIELAQLVPPATAAPQTLRAREIHPGVVFSDASLRWALEPTEDQRASRLHIERLETGFADGRLFVDEARLDPSSPSNQMDFRFEGADVGRLFEIAGLQDTSATGRLSGVIPVVVRGGAVAIPKGQLEARGGVLQMRSQQAASVLAGGGQSAALLLDVLRDFHYDDLVVTIEKSFEGDASVQIHLEGNNPGVLEGQPFRINLNVSGNLDRLIASLAEVARFSDRAVHATMSGVTREGR